MIIIKATSKILLLSSLLLLWACSTKKNTATTRLYHSINTRYNIYFNANEAYNEALKSKRETYQDTLSQMISVFPVEESKGSSFSTPIDKTTKAIKLHSIKSKPVRNPSKARDPKYKLWLQQQEFNPFLKNAWLLMGKAEYQDGDYLQSILTFTYITRLYRTEPEVVAEARIWLVKANLAQGWSYEAEDILNQIRLAGGVPDNLKLEYNKAASDFWVQKEDYIKALPYLEEAIQEEKNGLQKVRLKYLLAQIYEFNGDKKKAYQAYENLHGLSVPYFYSFNARIKQASFVDASNKERVLSDLNKMERQSKNKEYLDQVYYAIGNIYLNSNDTTKAIENYRKAIEKSTRNGPDKGLTDAVLGNIYFVRRDYVLAQPLYSEAQTLLSKKNKDYPLVALRSSVLDELTVQVEAIHLQDSLQQLARMPEQERLDTINKLIANLKKKAKEEQKKLEREARANETNQTSAMGSSSMFDSKTPDIPTAPLTSSGKDVSTFYFYNPQMVAQGKAAFQRKWGVRKPEDDWRRKDRQISLLANSSGEEQDNLSIENSSPPDEGQPNNKEQAAEEDIYSVDFYLQQIPFTPEAVAASDAIIEDAYFNMGKIYKDKLGDPHLSIEAFNTDLTRFPDTPNREEIYYQLFLIYLRLGDRTNTELYRQNILTYFAGSSYALALADPNYEWNMLNMHKVQDDLYQQTYDLYLKGQASAVRANYHSMKEKYPLSDLMPKFMFLDALTYAQRSDAEGFKKSLKNLIGLYPQADVTALATEMLKGIMNGRELSADNSPARGMIWDIRLGNDSASTTEGFDFVAASESPYLLLFVYSPQQVDKNELIYEVANYNFSKYVYQTFDLGFVRASGLEMLQVKGYKNLSDITLYIDKAFEKNSLMNHLDSSIIPIPISTDNYVALMNGKTLNQYFVFFEKNYTKEMLNLIRYWTKQREQMKEQAAEESVSETALPQKAPEPEVPISSKTDTIGQVAPQFIPDSPILPQAEPAVKDSSIVSHILTDEQIDEADRVINKVIDVVNNPLDGLKNLFKPIENEEGTTKGEQSEKKKLKKRQKELEKRLKTEQEAKVQAEAAEKEARTEQLEVAEKAKEDKVQKEAQEREAKLRAAEKAKDDARKQHEKELKDKAKARKEELKQKEQAQKARLKQKEKERKELLKKREGERKEKERLAKLKRKGKG